MAGPSIVPLVMPKWGLSMKEGTLSAWHVEEGQVIKPGQEIMDVETDKIANSVEAADGGLLRRRVGEVGQVYPVKALLGVLAPEEVPEAEIDAFVAAFELPAESDEDDEETPSYRFVETPSGRLRYAERPGDGDPIVFIHGFGGDLNNWMFNMDEAASVGPVYALDLPGHGGSSKTMANPGLDALVDAVEHFLQAAGLEDAHLVGHSMGGAVAAALALRRGNRARSLTLISPVGLGREINSSYIDGFVLAESRRDLKPVLKDLFADENLVSRQMVEDLLKFKRLDGVSQTLRDLAASLFSDGRQQRIVADALQAASVPVQVLWGAEDAVIPPEHAKNLPRARVEIIDGVGHMAMMEAAGKVNEAIRAQVKG
jgi:pyruvate dehydrogenase E2 component (dihydrolipoamide acetyltransferase)